MSRWGKIFWLVAALSMMVMVAVRYVLGGWIQELFIPLGIGGVAFVAAIIADYRLFLEFLTMRTTKHGMNMGSMILLVAIFLGAVNFLSIQKNKTWDLTEEKLFSLSQQSVDILKPLKEKLEVKIFYRGEGARGDLQRVRETLKLYEDMNSQVKVEYFDAYKENMLAQRYLNDLPDKEGATTKLFLFAEFAGKRERIEAPFDESTITSAFVKVTRKSGKKIYFLTGHGEKDLSSEGDDGLKGIKEELERYAAKVESLNLIEATKIPDDASAIAIAGPAAALFDGELKLLRDYARKGGRLLVLADPGQKHNLAQLTKTLGVEFANNFVINGGLQVSGVSQLTAVGLAFDQASEITKSFMNGNSYALFHLASEVKKAPDADSGLKVEDLVMTSPRGMTINELSESAKPSAPRSVVLGVSVKGKLSGGDAKETPAEFSAAIFGDSDFLTNKLLGAYVNRDLAMNAIGFLLGEHDLISVRPKQPKGTKLFMTNFTKMAVVVTGILVPLLLLIFGSVIWFRRRGA